MKGRFGPSAAGRYYGVCCSRRMQEGGHTNALVVRLVLRTRA